MGDGYDCLSDELIRFSFPVRYYSKTIVFYHILADLSIVYGKFDKQLTYFGNYLQIRTYQVPKGAVMSEKRGKRCAAGEISIQNEGIARSRSGRVVFRA